MRQRIPLAVQLWIDRASGNRFLLPVKRGPDTSLPERLLLPYWHDATVPAWSQDGAQIERGAQWYGGPHRERMMSGFGPYALTRLAIETGGDFTIFDQRGNDSPFRLDAMRPYQPDYGSAAEYLRSLTYSRLRQAVSAAVMLTYQNVIERPPTMEFVVGRSDEYPYDVVRYFLTPVDFRDELENRLVDEQRRAAAALRTIDQALAKFRDGDMEAEYRRERSPRWRAWYDLTRGRLLANHVRYLEYGVVCSLIQQAGGLRPETNRLILHPSPNLRTDSVSVKMAQEAKRLLTRCVKENPDTPWAYLAQWELDQPLGIAIEQAVIPRPANTLRAPAVPAVGGSQRVNLPRL
ncbi:MAG: hypothetical protein HY000_17295 [Planctomycetes bacterium]|nr:hypothetical protein [Planctomycetota bacterium]